MNIGAKTILSNSILFRGLHRSDLEALAELAVNRQYEPGEQLFRQGEPGQHLFGVLSGAVRISAQSEDGREVHLNLLGAGEVIGEIALLDGGARTATGIAVEPTMACVIPRTGFLDYLARHPAVAQGVIELLCERVRWTSSLIEDSAFHSVPERLARRLKGLAGEQGGEVRISQNDLARFLNVSRQVVNGYLKDWQRRGLIDLKRGRIVVHDLTGELAG